MILTKNEILKEMEKGNIKVDPFKKNQVGAGSIDLTLDNKFRIFRKNKKIVLREEIDYKKHTKLVTVEEMVLNPGELVLGITKEKLKLSSNFCGWLQGRSRFARLGLVVHATASFVQPGSENKQVLEILNLGPTRITLKPGVRICQLIIERTEGEAKFKGKFVNQEL